jgi:3-oxoadipate enol-lactonase
VVFIHGFGSDRRQWDLQWEPFAARNRVIRYDLRGFGKSAVPTGESYTHADDLRAMLDMLGVDRAILVGQSLGCDTAVSFALAYPNSAQGLILVDPNVGGFTYSQEWNESFTPIFVAGSAGDIETMLRLTLAHGLLQPTFERPEVRSDPKCGRC